MLSGHSAAQEIKHLWKFTSGFIGPQVLNFERSVSTDHGAQNSLVPPCKISLGGPGWDKIAEQKAHLNECIYESIKKMIYLFYFGKRARIKGLIPKLHIFGRNYIYNLSSSSNLTCLTSICSLNWLWP